ncbi:MAG: hypothetical protein IAG10_30045 [Planctomycetaceae bacterium]|nr:hypothetical protein [Planctomycetaceae bacterium]
MTCEVSSKQAGDAMLSWSLVVSGGVIARGEKGVTLDVARPVKVAWDADLPEVKPGLIVPATLRLAVHPRDGSPKFEPVEENVVLSICSPDATALRGEWLKSLDIVLFDPAERTADVFERNRIPCRVANDPQCAGLTKGLILYGEGIDPARLDAVWSAAVEAAAAGRRVLVMASPGAAVPMEGLLASSDDSIRSISLKRSDIIRELDKRLDATAWPKPGRLVASSLHWTVRGEQPRVEFRDDAEGWSWLHIRHRSGGRLIWLGFGLAESWDATPTARYLLLKVLEDLSTDKPIVEGKQNEN